MGRNNLDKKYCSRKCKGLASRRRVEIACPCCGREFYPFERDTKFCSWECSVKGQARKVPDPALIRAREEAQKAKAAYKAAKAAERAAEREAVQRTRRLERQKKLRKFCPICKKVFISKSIDRVYCSQKCASRVYSSNAEHRRRLLTHDNGCYEPGLSWRKVFSRDKGICYLCGKAVDTADFTMRGNVFIAGANYPSIDHVIPLSLGGTHTLDNIRLAHCWCNTIKSNTIDERNDHQQIMFPI